MGVRRNAASELLFSAVTEEPSKIKRILVTQMWVGNPLRELRPLGV